MWIETRGQPFFAAYGYLGQVLVVFPRLDDVVLVTSSREDYGETLELARRGLECALGVLLAEKKVDRLRVSEPRRGQ